MRSTKQTTGKLLGLAVFGMLAMAALFGAALLVDADTFGEEGEKDRQGKSPRGPHLPPEADTDGDGNITEAEREAWKALIDADGDGNITKEEHEAFREALHQERLAAKFTEMDTDGDGNVSEEEFMAWHEAKRAEKEEKMEERKEKMEEKKEREPREPRDGDEDPEGDEKGPREGKGQRPPRGNGRK